MAADLGRPAASLRGIFTGWAVHYLEVDGKQQAAALLHGTEAHFILAPHRRGRGLPRYLARSFASQLLEAADGMLTTRVLLEHTGAIRFVTRLGFFATWSDERFQYFAMTDPPFSR